MFISKAKILNASRLSPKICSKSLFFIPGRTFDTEIKYWLYKKSYAGRLRLSISFTIRLKLLYTQSAVYVFA